MHMDCFDDMKKQNMLSLATFEIIHSLLCFFICKIIFFFNLYYLMDLSNRYRCPICSKTVTDMSVFWNMLDEEVWGFLYYIIAIKTEKVPFIFLFICIEPCSLHKFGQRLTVILV